MPFVANLGILRRASRLGTRAALAAGRRLDMLRPARAQNQFATHIPILIGLARMVPIRRVLEMGCGHYSTLIFLDRRAFPDLIALESLETDPAWARQIEEEVALERRLKLRLVDDPLETMLRQLQLDSYDLLLVDHSQQYEIRAATISFLAACCSAQSLIVLHDYEIPLYRHAARGFRYKFEFTAFTPSTCVACHHAPMRGAALRLLERTVKSHARTLRPDNTAAWIDVLDAALAASCQPTERNVACALSSFRP